MSESSDDHALEVLPAALTRSWNPMVNALQSAVRASHAATELPWWASLVLCTVGFRVALLPLVNVQMKNTRRIMTTKAPEHFQRFTSLVVRDLQLHKNDAFSQKALLKHYRQGLGTILRKNDIKLWKFFIVPAIQIPTFISYVFAVRGLIADPAIAAEMRTGGMAWFEDLTLVDPYYALPITALGLTYMSLEKTWIFVPWLKNALQTLVLLTSPFVLSQLPSFVFMYWIPSAGFGLAQNTFLRYYMARQAKPMVVGAGAGVAGAVAGGKGPLVRPLRKQIK